MGYPTVMDRYIRKVLRAFTVAGLMLLLSGCVTYHQPRYGHDGVYFDQAHSRPQTVIISNPAFYPYRSLDFFYFSHFGYPYRWGGTFGHGWGSAYTGYHHPYWRYPHAPRPDVHPIDERLRAIDARGRSVRSGTTGDVVRPAQRQRLAQPALRIQRQGQARSTRAQRIQSAPRPAARSTSPTRSRQTPRRESATIRRPQQSRTPARIRSAPPRRSSSRPSRQIRDTDPR